MWMLYSLLSGGVMLGAVFMATDYATSPVTPLGQILYGISPFYQRNYIKISNFTIVVIAVMLICFTGVWAPIRLSCSYFVYNLSNDI